MNRAVGPLDPNPFTSRYARKGDAPLVVYAYHPDPDLTHAIRIETVSVAVVAYIPPKHLSGIYASFADDGVTQQPQWLSEAYLANRYRFAHGIQVAIGGTSHWSRRFESTIFAVANPTTIRFVPLIRFVAPVEIARPTVLPPPPTMRSRPFAVAGSHGRSKNGFLSTRLGAVAARAQALRPDQIPQIGVSLQAWIEEPPRPCKCIAVAHNFFPKYDIYLDGVRLDFNELPFFERFDAYDLPVEWRVFMAFSLYAALRPFPLVQRYPGNCLVGWYDEITPSGEITWCDGHPPPASLEYDPPPSEDYIVEWWHSLEAFLELYEQLSGEFRDHESLSLRWFENEKLQKLWRALTERASSRRHVPAG